MSDDYKMDEHEDSTGEDDDVQSINTEMHEDSSDDKNNKKIGTYQRMEVIDITYGDNNKESDNEEDSYDEKVGNKDDDSEYEPPQNENKSDSKDDNDDDNNDVIDQNQKQITDYIRRNK